MSVLVKNKEFLIGLFVSIACSAGYFAWYKTGFSGESIFVFCESDTGGLFKQDSNSVSSLLFVFFGLAIAWNTGRREGENVSPNPRNLMKSSTFFSGFYCLVLILLGFGTLAIISACAIL